MAGPDLESAKLPKDSKLGTTIAVPTCSPILKNELKLGDNDLQQALETHFRNRLSLPRGGPVEVSFPQGFSVNHQHGYPEIVGELNLGGVRQLPLSVRLDASQTIPEKVTFTDGQSSFEANLESGSCELGQVLQRTAEKLQQNPATYIHHVLTPAVKDGVPQLAVFNDGEVFEAHGYDGSTSVTIVNPPVKGEVGLAQEHWIDLAKTSIDRPGRPPIERTLVYTGLQSGGSEFEWGIDVAVDRERYNKRFDSLVVRSQDTTSSIPDSKEMKANLGLPKWKPLIGHGDFREQIGKRHRERGSDG